MTVDYSRVNDADTLRQNALNRESTRIQNATGQFKLQELEQDRQEMLAFQDHLRAMGKDTDLHKYMDAMIETGRPDLVEKGLLGKQKLKEQEDYARALNTGAVPQDRVNSLMTLGTPQALKAAEMIQSGEPRAANVLPAGGMLVGSDGRVLADNRRSQNALLNQGGSTGYLVQQYMDATGSDFPTALYAVQTGLRQGTSFADGRVAPLPGAPEARGAIKREEEKDKAIGEAQGKAIGEAPKAIQQSSQMLSTIDNVLNDPSLKGLGTGGASVLANKIPGTPTYDFQQKVDQLKGQAFLQAYETLKGGGQITEAEGQKATQAIARLQTAQTERAFTESLNELRRIVVAAKQRAEERIGKGQTPESVGTKSGFDVDAFFKEMGL